MNHKTFFNCLLLISSFVLLPTQNMICQRFNGGLIAGLSTSQVDGDTQKGYDKPGFYAGVYVETSLNELFGLKSELFYISKGAKKTINKLEEFNTTLNYMELPVYLSFKPLKNGEISAGFAVSYLISSKLVNYGEIVEGALYDMHDFDFSFLVALNYHFTERLGICARVDYSLVPVKKHPNWFNNNLSFGITYQLGTKKP